MSTLEMFSDVLRDIDAALAESKSPDIPTLFRDIPLDLFGRLLLDVPDEYANINTFFPSMPPEDVQVLWTGSHGAALLDQSAAFVKTIAQGYLELTGNDIRQANVLDFGCGWGRLIRLMYKFLRWEQIYGVDPWDESIKQCEQHHIKAHLALSHWVPKNLPFERRFQLIYAFSVFTHLSEKTALVALQTLRRHVEPNGLLAITIRPKEYWQVHDGGKLQSQMTKAHDERGFAYWPHNLPPIDGEVTYGDTSMSLDYVRTRFPDWAIEKLEWNAVDPYQTVLFLRPV